MKNRTCRFELRLTKDEFTELTRKARKARLTNAALVRRAISGLEVKEAPPMDVPVLIQEVRKVGNDINQLLKLVNIRGTVDAALLQKALEENRAVTRQIIRAYAMTED